MCIRDSYVVVKIPKWQFEKFPGSDETLGPQMKSVGEVMAMGRTFKEALMKAWRALETGKKTGAEVLEPRRLTQKLVTPQPEMCIRDRPDGVFLSNGPGDPEPVDYAVQAIREMMGRVPVFGICLGHQLCGLALGGKTYKLKFGHHGGNHPVRNNTTGKVEIRCV